MNAHLNERQFGEWILGTGNEEIARHVEACDLCRTEADSVRTAISACRELADNTAARGEIFWARQRRAIRQRLARPRFVPHVRWVAAAVMVLVVSAAFLLTRPQPVQRANDDAADDVLLQQVQTDIERNYPAALAPAVLIDEERNSALSAGAEQSSNH